MCHGGIDIYRIIAPTNDINLDKIEALMEQYCELVLDYDNCTEEELNDAIQHLRNAGVFTLETCDWEEQIKNAVANNTYEIKGNDVYKWSDTAARYIVTGKGF